MTSKTIGNVLFFRTGLREHVRDDIERQEQRARKTTDKIEKHLRQLQAANADVEERLGQLGRRYDVLAGKYAAATDLLAQQRARFGQLKDDVQLLKKSFLDERMTVLENARRDDQADRLRLLMSELETRFTLASLTAHVRDVIARSPLMNDPYPHVVLEEVLPQALHDLLYEARPTRGFWRGGQQGRENWTIGEDLAPLPTEAAWRFMDDLVVPRVVMPALTEMFSDYLRSQLGGKSRGWRDVHGNYERSGGRLMLRRPGYHFEPHLDPRRALLTGLFYFGAVEDTLEFGTKLFRASGAIPETHRGVYYPLQEGAACELVKTVPSRPNSMLVFASRIGLHGADIPADAQPQTLERFAYQFYVGRPQGRG